MTRDLDMGRWVKIEHMRLRLPRTGLSLSNLTVETAQTPVQVERVLELHQVVHPFDGLCYTTLCEGQLRAFPDYYAFREVMPDGWQPEDFVPATVEEQWLADRNAIVRALCNAWASDMDTWLTAYGSWEQYRSRQLVLWEYNHPRPGMRQTWQ